MGRSRTYHDPLHGAITLDRQDAVEALLIELIDTPEFQRLRRIRQLGPASLTFHGAESSRFTHSVGVMAIARRAFDRLAHLHPHLSPHRATVLCAALLHDIGHGPFSHTCEEIFGNHHEHWTQRILRESPTVRALLDRFDPQLLPSLEQVYQKQHPIPLVWQLVSSQLDCDRLDYLMRDSYFTGATYGRIDLERILLALEYDPVSQQLVVAHKGITAIEHYLIVRYFMYVQVYNHPKNLAAAWVLEQAFKRAQQFLTDPSLWVDELLRDWLTQDVNSLPLERYLGADDGVFLYHIHRWQQHSDPVLSDLCRRCLDRDLLKVMQVSAFTPEQQARLVAIAHNLVAQHSPMPEFYTGLRTTFSRGYTLYQQGIKLRTDQGLVQISDRSPLVKTLIQPWTRTWLLYPRSIQADLWAAAQSFTPSL